jgi:hypothetical protein
MVKRLVSGGFLVRGADLKYQKYSNTTGHYFLIEDLRDPYLCKSIVGRRFDEV